MLLDASVHGRGFSRNFQTMFSGCRFVRRQSAGYFLYCMLKKEVSGVRTGHCGRSGLPGPISGVSPGTAYPAHTGRVQLSGNPEKGCGAWLTGTEMPGVPVQQGVRRVFRTAGSAGARSVPCRCGCSGRTPSPACPFPRIDVSGKACAEEGESPSGPIGFPPSGCRLFLLACRPHAPACIFPVSPA